MSREEWIKLSDATQSKAIEVAQSLKPETLATIRQAFREAIYGRLSVHRLTEILTSMRERCSADQAQSDDAQ